jgi:glycosyltransferase involved in cell wall biosynthesis
LELLWITNIATPYTVPVWRELGKLTDLHVACLARTESNRQWQLSLDDVPSTVLGAKPIRAGGQRTLYAPTPRLLTLFRQRPDVVVLDGWESPAFWQARILAKLYGTRVVMSYWSTAQTHRFSTGPIAAFRSWFFRSADGVITPGPAATEAVRAMGVPASRITTGFGTVDVARFSTGARSTRARLARRLGHHFIYVGQLIPRKNVDTLLQALAAMRGISDTLTIVGTGPLDDDLRRLTDELGLADKVRFEGHQDIDELIDSYAATDTLVLPSTEEVWGLVVNEALSAGLSVVVSDRCGVSRSVAQMPGVYVTEPDEEGLTTALTQARRDAHRPDESHPINMMTPSALASHLIKTFASQQKARAS